MVTTIMACCIFASMFSIYGYADESDVISAKVYYEVFDTKENLLATLEQEPTQNQLDTLGVRGEVVIVKTKETIRQLRLDLSKTVEKEYTNIFVSGTTYDFTPPSDLDSGGKVKYKLRASITYDPNTYQITSATRIIRVNIFWSEWDGDMHPYTVNEISFAPVIASNRLSATFKHSMAVKADYLNIGTVGYGTLVKSFTITPG